MNGENKSFEGSNWDEYTPFEFGLIEILLTREILDNQDIENLAKQCDSIPSDILLQNLPAEELGDVLINDATKGDLLPKIKEILLEKYPKKLSLEQAEVLFKIFEKMDREIAEKVYLAISQNNDIIEIIKTGRGRDLFDESRLAFLILEEFYRR